MPGTVNLNLQIQTINDLSGKSWVIYGDSFNADLPTSYSSIVSDKLQLTATTYGVSGNKYSDQLAVVQAQINSDPDFFKDFDIASIHLGVNDFAANYSLGFLSSLPSSNTIAGHCKKMIELILFSNPEIKLYLITPPKADGQGVDWDAVTASGYKLEDISSLISSIGAYYGVQVIDLTSICPFNLQTIPTLTVDGLHPSTVGKEIIAQIVLSGIYNGISHGRTKYDSLSNSDQRIENNLRLIVLPDNTGGSKLQIINSVGTILFEFRSDAVSSWGLNGAFGELSWDGVFALINAKSGKKIKLFAEGDYFIVESGISRANKLIGSGIGTTAERPAGKPSGRFFDTSLGANGKPIWFNGSDWVDASGTIV